jgi:hypothetical protein
LKIHIKNKNWAIIKLKGNWRYTMITPNINLETLRQALKKLNDLPQSTLVQRHPERADLFKIIENDTKDAIEMLEGVIQVIESNTTLQDLVRGRNQ